MYKIATWNVNSINVRQSHIVSWLQQNEPNILAIQETKISDDKFPAAAFQEIGYHTVYAGQPAYNGMAIISKNPACDIVTDFPNVQDPQRRLLAVTIDGIRIVNVYVPNGESLLSDKYQYKLKWLQSLHQFLAHMLQDYPQLVVLGDFNIAPQEQDVYDPAICHDQVLVSDPERAAFKQLLALGLADSFRLFPQTDTQFSWWDYRAGSFRRNLGLRIDHILLSGELSANCLACRIDKYPRGLERPSDHAPVMVDLKF